MTEEKKRGFAAMDPAVVRSIARKGGRSGHAQGKAHQFTSEEARAAGAKGRETQREALLQRALYEPGGSMARDTMPTATEEGE